MLADRLVERFVAIGDEDYDDLRRMRAACVAAGLPTLRPAALPVDTAAGSLQDHGMAANANLRPAHAGAAGRMGPRCPATNARPDRGPARRPASRPASAHRQPAVVGDRPPGLVRRAVGPAPRWAASAFARADADALYDSSAVPHATRWDLPLPSRTATLDYMHQVQERVLDVLDRGPNPTRKPTSSCWRSFMRTCTGKPSSTPGRRSPTPDRP